MSFWGFIYILLDKLWRVMPEAGIKCMDKELHVNPTAAL